MLIEKIKIEGELEAGDNTDLRQICVYLCNLPAGRSEATFLHHTNQYKLP